MSNNIYIIMGIYHGVPEAVAIATGEEEFEDYVNTRKMDNLKVMVINADHPKCPPIDGLYEDNDKVIIDYYENCPITKEEEEISIQLEGEIHTHMLNQLSSISEEINKPYIRFNKDELRDIAEMISIFRKHISTCCDEEGCIDITEEMNFKELLKHSNMIAVPFKE